VVPEQTVCVPLIEEVGAGFTCTNEDLEAIHPLLATTFKFTLNVFAVKYVLVAFKVEADVPSPKSQVVELIVPELVVVVLENVNEFPLKHCVGVFILKSTIGAGRLETVMSNEAEAEDPHPFEATTEIFPLLVEERILIDRKVDVPVHPLGKVQV
jgi:hypothetical protein